MRDEGFWQKWQPMASPQNNEERLVVEIAGSDRFPVVQLFLVMEILYLAVEVDT